MHCYQKSVLLLQALLILVCTYLVPVSLLANQANAGVRVLRTDHLTGNPAHLHIEEGVLETARDFPSKVHDMLELTPDFEFRGMQSYADPWGSEHFRFQQYYLGKPIKGCVIVLHFGEGASITGRFVRQAPGSSRASLPEESALSIALMEVGAETYIWELEANDKNLDLYHPSELENPKGELIYFPMKHNGGELGDFRLVYRFEIYSLEPHAKQAVLVDAVSGEVLSVKNLMPSEDVVGTANTKWSGQRSINCDSHEGSYRLRETLTGGGIRTRNLQQTTTVGGIVDFTDSDNYWSNFNSDQDEVATDAHWALQQTYELYDDLFDWKSFDNLDTRVDNLLHYDVDYSNSFWDPVGRIIIGDGDGVQYLPFASIDVIGHEFTHGVVEHTADLVYEFESGALNESFCDIFGNAVERSARPENADWYFGSEICLENVALRSMSSPKDLYHPDTYDGYYWTSEPFANADNDYGWVHSNSGVQNKWFYLLSQGGSGTNDHGDSYSITPIGQNKALNIAFLNLSAYLSPYSDYQDARYYSILAAKQLYGECSAEEVAVTNAWYAVGVGNAFASSAPQADFTAYPTEYCLVGSPVHFQNLTPGAESYAWNFGDGTTSQWSNPIHTYSTPGTYTVTLIVTGCGADDSRIRSNYINVSAANACVYDIDYTALHSSCEGRLFDEGGGTTAYPANSQKSTVIAPAGASSVRLQFQSFDYWSDDYLKIYDGNSTASTLIGTYTGNVLPNGGIINSSGGAITVEHFSNGTGQAGGFELTWSCEINECTPFQPNISSSNSSFTFCSGESLVLSGAAGYSSYQWSNNQSGSSISVTEPGTYFLTVTDNAGCQGQSQITVEEQAAPSAFVGQDVSICPGGSVALVAGGGQTYEWSPTTGLSNPYVYNPIASPQSDQLYTVTVFDSFGCSSQNDIMVSVGGSLEVDVIEHVYICPGESAYLYASGGTQYEWSPQTGLSDPYSASPIAGPMSDQLYTVTVSDGNSCTGEAQVQVHVNGPIPIEVSANQNICPGASAQLGASGGVSYQWSPSGSLSNSNIQNPIASPLQDQLYTVTVTDQYGCSAIDVVQVNVEAISTSASADAHICAGGSATISAYGGVDYQWSPTVGLSDPNIANPVASPPTDQLYSVMITDSNGCTAEESVWVYLDSELSVSVSPEQHICPGASVALQATGGSYYQWSPTQGLSDPNIANPIAIPSNDQLYTVSVSDGNGCVNQASVWVYLDAELDISVSEDLHICPGASVSLQASGGQFYSWSPPTGLSNPNIANPVATVQEDMLYTVTVSDLSGCVNQGNVMVYADQSIMATISEDTEICPGTSVQLTAGGGQYYSWSPAEGLSNANVHNPVAAPASDQVYTVTVTDLYGCVSEASVLVSVSDGLPVTVTPLHETCAGSTVQLQASGGLYYQWSPSTGLSNANIANPVATVYQNTNYTVTVDDGFGCTGQNSVIVEVADAPTLVVSPDLIICQGESAELSAAGAESYQWNPAPGLTAVTGSVTTAAPSSSQTYSVYGTDANGCVGYAEVHVEVLDFQPQITQNQGICKGESTQLSCQGSSFVWSPEAGLSNPLIASPHASPEETTEYTVVVQDENGCQTERSVIVYVYDLGETSVSEDVVICPGESVLLQATGGDHYSWSADADPLNQSEAQLVVAPNESQLYQVEVSNEHGCSEQHAVFVEVLSIEEIDYSGLVSVCPGEPAVIFATGAASVQWWPETGLADPTAASTEANPASSTTYVATLTQENGCVQNITVAVEVNAAPVLQLGSDPTICAGDVASLQASIGPGTLFWSPADAFENPSSTVQLISPEVTTEYTAQLTSPDGCVTSESITVTVIEAQEIANSQTILVCPGEAFQLPASEGETHSWHPADGLSATDVQNPMITTDQEQLYTVTITQAGAACKFVEEVYVELAASGFAQVAQEQVFACKGEEVQLQSEGGVSYSWSPAVGLSDTESATTTVIVEEAQVYAVAVTSADGCLETRIVEVIPHADDFAQSSGDVEICLGDQTELEVSGGSYYYWWPQTGLSSVSSANPIAEPAESTLYRVAVLNELGCRDTASVYVSVGQSDFLEVEEAELEICRGDTVSLTGMGAENYYWWPADEEGSTIEVSPKFDQLYVLRADNAKGCEDFAQVRVKVHHSEIAASKDREICRGEPVKLWASGGSSYVWTPLTAVASPLEAHTIGTPDESTLYTVLVQDEFGCDYEEEVMISVMPCCTASGSGTAEWIASVQVNGEVHESGNEGYALFEQAFEPLILGSSVTLSLSPGFALSNYTQRWRVWIDHNSNEDFEPSELVFESQSNEQVFGGFSLSESQEPGFKLMRVVMQLDTGEWPDACGNFYGGEVEDYLIEFKEP